MKIENLYAISSTRMLSLIIGVAVMAGCHSPPPCFVPALRADTGWTTRFKIASRLLNDGYDQISKEIRKNGWDEAGLMKKREVSAGQSRSSMLCAQRAKDVLDLDDSDIRIRSPVDEFHRQGLLKQATLLYWYADNAPYSKEAGVWSPENLTAQRNDVERFINKEPRPNTPKDHLNDFQLYVALLAITLHFTADSTKDLRILYDSAKRIITQNVNQWGPYEQERAEREFVLDKTIGIYLDALSNHWSDVQRGCRQLRDKLRSNGFKTDAKKAARRGVQDCDKWLKDHASSS